MKLNPLWMICGVIVLSSAPSLALAPVESRRGTPVIRSSAGADTHHGTHVESGSSMAENRTAHLTLRQIEALKQEVSELRGLVETQQHEIERLKKSQQDFYVDLDKRLSQLQKNPTVADKSKEETKPVAKATTSPVIIPAGKTNSTEKEIYEAAYSLVRTKQYAEAVTAFQAYLDRFSKGERAPNAYYWLGEIYMVQWEVDKMDPDLLDKAAQAFSSVTSQFPTHQKVADALLKLGLVETEKGDWEAAREYLTQVKNRYPGTAAARIAETHLQQLN